MPGKQDRAATSWVRFCASIFLNPRRIPMIKNRQNFSQLNRWQLAMSVNFRCARPGCGLVTHFYDPSRNKTINIQGQAAHIHAASPRGPRYEPDLTAEQTRSFKNGVWLCANCATLIDRLPDEHPSDLLYLWHADAVDRIRRTGLGAGGYLSFDARKDAEAVKSFLATVDNIANEWKPGESITWEAVCALQNLLRMGSWSGPGNPNLAIQHPLRNRQLAMCELARVTYLASQGRERRYCAITREGDNTIIGYRIGSYESLDRHTLKQWSLEDEARHNEFFRLYRELRLYLSGGPMTLSGVDW